MPGQYTQTPEMYLYHHQHYEHVQTGAQSERERLFSMLYTESGLKEYGCHLDFDPESVLDTYKWQIARCNMGLRPVGTAWHLPIFFAFCLFLFLLELSSLVEYSGECHKIECHFLRSPSRWIVGTSLGIQLGHK